MAFVNPTNYPLINGPQEIAQPFNIDQYGEVSFFDRQGEAAKWRLLSLLLTSPGERVMRPNYGVGLFGFVFENDDPVVVAGFQAQITEQAALYEPSISVRSVAAAADSINPAQANLAVSFSLQGTQQPYKAVINSDGQVVETQ